LWTFFTYGEVEDYSVNIVEASENTSPTAPTNLASQTTTSSTNLSWTASTDDEAVTGYYVYNGEEIITAVSGTSYTVTGLLYCILHFFCGQDAAEFINS
jgi:fibronectin type 3 domain-containing protein